MTISQSKVNKIVLYKSDLIEALKDYVKKYNADGSYTELSNLSFNIPTTLSDTMEDQALVNFELTYDNYLN